MRLGEMLVKAGVTTELNVNAALAEQRRWGGKIGQILVRMGAVPEHTLVQALSRQLGVPWLDLATVETVPDALSQRLPRAWCEQHLVIPLQYLPEQRVVRVAMADPRDLVVHDDLQRRFGTRIEPLLVGEQALLGAIRRLFGAQSSQVLREETSGPVLMDNAGEVRLEALPRVASPAPGAGTSSPAAPRAAPPASAATVSAALEQRIASHSHNVRAVADLLIARGVVRPDDLPRQR